MIKMHDRTAPARVVNRRNRKQSGAWRTPVEPANADGTRVRAHYACVRPWPPQHQCCTWCWRGTTYDSSDDQWRSSRLPSTTATIIGIAAGAGAGVAIG